MRRRPSRAGLPVARWFHLVALRSPTSLAVIDLEGNVFLASRRLIELGQFDATKTYALADCVIESEREEVAAAFARARNGESVRFDTTLLHASGGTSFVGVSLYPLYRRRTLIGVGARIHGEAQLLEAQERRLEKLHSMRLRQLYLVAASAGRTPQQQLEALLRFGNEIFDTDDASVSELDGDELSVRFAAGSRAKPAGYVRKVGQSFTRSILENGGVVAIDDLNAPPWCDDAARVRHTLTALIGTSVQRFGKVYGSIVFGTDAPGGRRFSESDKDLMRLMAALCGSALERLAHEERLGALAFYDALTGLPNRVLFDDRLEQTLAAARRHRQKFAVLYIDLDDFKEVNDIHGHEAGDELLRVVSRRLLTAARESDTVARRGGDEFVALQRFVRSQQDAMRLARRINEVLRQPIALGDSIVVCSASIGIALYPNHGTTAQQLLFCADVALYRAKDAGRDQAVLYKELVSSTN